MNNVKTTPPVWPAIVSKPGRPQPAERVSRRIELESPTRTTDDANPDRTTLKQLEFNKIKQVPKEVGVMLITAGIVGFILPGPGTPAIIAGGLSASNT